MKYSSLSSCLGRSLAGASLLLALSCSSARPERAEVKKIYSGSGDLEHTSSNGNAAVTPVADAAPATDAAVGPVVVSPQASAPAPAEPPTPASAEVKKVLTVSVSLSPIPAVTLIPNSAFPRAVNLADGTLIVVYNQDIEGFHTLKTEISRDNGKSWQEFSEIAREAVSATRELRDANLVRLPSGTLLAIYRNISDGIFRLQTSASTDGGQTWAFQGTVEALAGVDARNMLHPIMMVNAVGQVQAYYSKQKALNGALNIVMRTSSDEGRTWVNEITVATRALGNASFPGVTRLKDGGILLAFDTPRTDGDSHLILRSTQSNNDGLSWSSPQDIYVPLNGLRSAKSPQVSLLADGRPVVFFMSDEDGTEEDCCNIKMMISRTVATAQNLEWLALPITAIPGTGSVFPSGVATNDGAFQLFYEKAARVFSNRVSIQGGL